ncbi:uncharacterized protein Adt_11444 [Abeliophyllum distichum]|uniref:Uncharacterized protein n=1 Tax=Abeliophyllum distichum TaxID=126358 RepID=A0ABD1UN36_9LAMI
MGDNNRIRDPPLADAENLLAVEVNERDIILGEYMMPPIVENRSSIIHPSYGHDNFQLRPDVINVFSNNLPFLGELIKICIITSLALWNTVETSNIKGLNEEALRIRLFSHTLKDKAWEWLASLP